jgi:hypothetical protein
MPRQKRSYWHEADARRALAEIERRGEADVAYQRRTGVPASRLGWWRRRLGGSNGGAHPLQFLPVQVRGPAAPSPRPPAEPRECPSPFEVVVSGHVVRVPAEFDDKALVRLVAALSHAPC